MNEQDITITRAPINHIQQARIYYYKGNVFQPLGYKNRKVTEQTESKIRAWLRDNKEMVKRDRETIDYMTLTELFERQVEMYSVNNG